MLTCKDICDNATRYLEEDAGFLELAGLRIHLLMCKECRRFVRQFRIMVGSAAKLSESEEPTDKQIDELAELLSSRHQH